MFKKIQNQLLGLMITAMFALLIAETAEAQRRFSPTRVGRNSTAMKTTLESLVQPIKSCICEMKNGREQVALGTIVSADGLIVTKLSEVQFVENLTCQLAGEKTVDAKVVGKSERYDLALVKVDATDLSAVELDTEVADLNAGNIVLSANENGRAISMGITTVAPRTFEMRQPRAESGRGFLGVECSPVDEGLEIGRVTEGSGAQKAGLKRSDILVEFEGKKVPSVAKLIELLGNYAPNDDVSVLVAREDEELSVTVRLGRVPVTTGVQDRWGGGPFSERRFGFPKVIAHDCAIKPDDCGGPLLNSDGKVIGINIARALRVSTYAVPASYVAKFIADNKDK